MALFRYIFLKPNINIQNKALDLLNQNTKPDR